MLSSDVIPGNMVQHMFRAGMIQVFGKSGVITTTVMEIDAL